MGKTTAPPTFRQLYLAHVRSRAALLLSDATLLFLLVVGPIILLVSSRIMEAFGAGQKLLHVADTTDGVWLVLAVGLVCLDSLGKFIVISIFSWREVLQNKS
jgi:hypothetical protein